VAGSRVPWMWDYDLDEDQFSRLVSGELTAGPLDRDWAVVRLLEYAPYSEIRRRLSFRSLVEGWERWRPRLRSPSRIRGLDFLVEYLRNHRMRLVS